METNYPAELQKVADFHGHSCLGMALGYRASMIALRELQVSRAKDEELVAVVYNDSCAADAVQVVTGCTFGKGNLVFRDYGKMVLTLGRRNNDQTVRVALRYGVLTPKVMKDNPIGTILNLPEEELYKVDHIKVDLPPPARIYRTIQCAVCGEGVMEPRVRMKEGKPICLECAAGMS